MIRAVGLACLLLSLPCAAHAAELRVGAAATVVTPPQGTPLAGYYEPRSSTKVLDDLHSKALVLEHDGVKVALVVCDLISLPRHTVVDARKLIEKETGIPGAHVLIAATHTHTGPVIRRESERDKLDGGTSDLARRYAESLPGLIARSVAEANARLAPARTGVAVGKEEQLSFNRRFWMKDGTVSWNPRKNHPDIVRPAGPIDPDVHLVYFDTPQGAPLASFVNFAMHPDTTGGTVVSADFPGVLARLLAEVKGPDMLTVFANGCCGNLNHRNIRWDERQSSPAEAKRLGTILAGAVCRTYPELKAVPPEALRARHEIVKLPLAPITPSDVEKARAVQGRLRDPKTTFMEKVKAFQVLDVAGRNGRPWEVEVQVLTLGDQLAWVSLPGEIFVELGLAIKQGSPFRHTMIAELANGSVGYVPNKAAYPEGNYEVVSARCAEGSGELLVEAALRMLKGLHAEAVKK
jgi:neutral ceramidase